MAQLRLRRAHRQTDRRARGCRPYRRSGRAPGGCAQGCGERLMTRVLVAGVGNMLRRDDGFGPAVAATLAGLPPGVAVVETGIGGGGLLPKLPRRDDGVILLGAGGRGAGPPASLVLR